MSVKLKYETGVATTVQLIIISIFNFIGGVTSSVGQCTDNSGNCVSNIILSLLYFLLLSVWFIALWLVGLAAQDRRSKRLSQFLIAGELLVAAVSLFDLTHSDPSIVSRLTSLAGLILSVWIMLLAFRLMRSKGGRVRVKNRARRRHNSQS